MRKTTAGLAAATLMIGLAATPLALAQGEQSQSPMTGGDMQGMEGMMGMMQMMEACTKMMQAMADQPKPPTTPQTEQQGG